MISLPRIQILFTSLLLALPSPGRTAPADTPTIPDIVYAKVGDRDL
jgi:hypothetical protein